MTIVSVTFVHACQLTAYYWWGPVNDWTPLTKILAGTGLSISCIWNDIHGATEANNAISTVLSTVIM